MKCPICNSRLDYIDSFSKCGVMFSSKTKIGEIYKCSQSSVIDFATRKPFCESIKEDGYITVVGGENFLGKPKWTT